MLMRAFYRSHLHDSAKAQRLLAKVEKLYVYKKNCIVIEKKDTRFEGQNLTSLTITEASPTNTLVFDPGSHYGLTAASAIIQGLTFTAKAQIDSYFANDVQIEYINPGELAPLAVLVVGRKITVYLGHDGTDIISTADDVKAAIVADFEGNKLVGIAGTGATPLTAQVLTGLTGGTSEQSYDLADIQIVQRIRSRKYKFTIKASA